MDGPLLLSPFEEYMLLDDRPAYRMNVFARLSFQGAAQSAAAQAAFDEVVARHPLCRMRVAAGRRGALQWTPATTESRFSLDGNCMADDLPAANPIDLRGESGFRLRVGSSGNRTTALFQIHHACCDGVGLFQLVEDWLLAYDRIVRQEAGALGPKPLDESRLRTRDRCTMLGAKMRDIVRHHVHGGERARKFFMHGPEQLLDRSLSDVTGEPHSDTASVEMDASGFQALRDDAKLHGVTLNTIFLRDLFLAVGGFQLQRQQVRGGAWLRVAVPINMRTNAHRAMPAANVVSMVFLDRRRSDFADRARLLAGLHDEMQTIKRNELGLTFLLALWIVKCLPGGIGRMTSPGKCSATCVLSNVGEPLAATPLARRDGKLRAGNLTLEAIDFLPPTRPGTAAAFGILSYAGRLRVALHFDSRLLTSAEAGQLLGGYVEQMNRQRRRSMIA